jgi:hypothetical protein
LLCAGLLLGVCGVAAVGVLLLRFAAPASKTPAAVQPQKDPVDLRLENPKPLVMVPFEIDPALKDGQGNIFLSDMTEFATTPGPPNWSFAKKGQLGNGYEPGAVVRVDGVVYAKGLGMHPPWGDSLRVCYALGKQAKMLYGIAAVNDTALKQTPRIRFVVFGDSKLLWRSIALCNRAATEAFKIDVGEVDILELRTYTEDGSVNQAHAVCLDPFVTKK